MMFLHCLHTKDILNKVEIISKIKLSSNFKNENKSSIKCINMDFF